MIIDVHTHVFPDHVAGDTVPAMAAEAGIEPAGKGTASDLLASMDTTGVSVSWLQPVATRPEQVEKINAWGEKKRTGRLVYFGAVHPDSPDLGGLMRDLSKRGFPGVKLHPEYQKFQPLDERLFPLYEAASEERMIILYHAGIDIGIPTLNSVPGQFASLIERFPDLILILAHMGGFRQWDDVIEHLAGRPIYYDTSYIFRDLPIEEFAPLVKKLGTDRVVFGTDYPWASHREGLDYVRAAGLAPEHLDRILGSNAQRVMGERR